MRGVRPWFLAAWVLLVVVVAAGFYIQARTIESLHDTQARQDALIARFQVERQNDILAICDITLTLNPDQEPLVRKTLLAHGITCP